MVASTEALREHKQKYGVTYMINLFGSVIPIVMFLIYASTQISNLATQLEVQELIDTHNISDMHPAAQSAVNQVDRKIDSILLFQLEDRIEKQIRVVCQNPDLRGQLEGTIRGLIQQYNDISPRPYQRPTCAQLGV